MEETIVRGVIYKITCTITGKSYIGQAKLKKTKNGKAYNYGSRGRWNDHKSSAPKSTTPLAKDIVAHGADAFVITDLETVNEDDLDACEAHWIETENTLVPHGYNVMSHSRNKHNRTSELYKQFVGRVAIAEIHPVENEGKNSFVYLYLILHDKSSKRLTFGQNKDSTFQQAIDEAKAFAEHLDCELKDFTGSDEPYSEQTRTLYGLTGTIDEVTITSASNLVAVYIHTTTMKARKEMLRICFGGKTIMKSQAYIQALQYIQKLPMPHDSIVNDKLKSLYNHCQQQAAAPGGEVAPQEKNSVTTSGGSALSSARISNITV